MRTLTERIAPVFMNTPFQYTAPTVKASEPASESASEPASAVEHFSSGDAAAASPCNHYEKKTHPIIITYEILINVICYQFMLIVLLFAILIVRR
jgi:hypothetical protein